MKTTLSIRVPPLLPLPRAAHTWAWVLLRCRSARGWPARAVRALATGRRCRPAMGAHPGSARGHLSDGFLFEGGGVWPNGTSSCGGRLEQFTCCCGYRRRGLGPCRLPQGLYVHPPPAAFGPLPQCTEITEIMSPPTSQRNGRGI